MARTISPIDITTISALATEGQCDKDLRRQAYWPRVRAGQMRQADADAHSALMATIVRRLTVTVAL